MPRSSAEAQALGLAREALSSRAFTLLVVAYGVPAACVWAVWGIGPATVAVAVAASLLGWLYTRRLQRETPRARRRRLRPAGWVRAELAMNPVFEPYSPLAVELWDRLLAYGAGVGVARGASRPLPFRADSETSEWIAREGRWYEVTISYPKLWPPRWGVEPGSVLAVGLVAAGVSAGSFRPRAPSRLGASMAAPKRFPDRDPVAIVRAATEALEAGGELDETRRLAGRVMARREMGKLVFCDLVDRSGRIQLMCDTGRIGDVDVHLGDVVGVVGRPAKSRRGEPSLAVDEIVVLARNTSPLPDTFHGLTDVETRYRKRYLDLLMNEESRELFGLRAKVITAIRRYLDQEGFVEVETPVLQPRYGGAFAHPFVTRSNELESDLYLRIATELYLKRLIVGGLERVYEIGKDFRNESVSYKHQPEFTMLEWYEAYADFRDTMDRIEEMLERIALEALGTTVVTFRGHEVDLRRPWKRIGFVESLESHELWTRDEGELRAWLTERGVDTEADKDWPQLVDHAFGHFVEPSLIEPTIVYGHPVELSPFARVTDEDETITDRFEYFAAGMELGNAYTEINEAEEQQRRFDEQSTHVEGVRGDPDYVEALAYGMPPTGGLGLGIDRLVMLLAGRETIRDVILFPALRAER